MKELPENYTLQQAYNDILYLGVRLASFEELVINQLEFLTNQILRARMPTMKKLPTAFNLSKRMIELEERLEGLTIHYSATLKELNNQDRRKVDKQGYTIK